jgi:hypothetical protein
MRECQGLKFNLMVHRSKENLAIKILSNNDLNY